MDQAPSVPSCDVLVVGAGAAGLTAATMAAQRGREVVLLEKNARPGLKILISGGGRCNLTTTLSGRALEEQYGQRRGRWLRHALRSFQPDALRRHVEELGVPLREEDLDKVFPVSGRARDVLDALLQAAEARGVRLVREAPMQRLQALDGGGFEVFVTSVASPLASLQLYVGAGLPGPCGLELPGLGELLLELAPFPHQKRNSFLPECIQEGLSEREFERTFPVDPSLIKMSFVNNQLRLVLIGRTGTGKSDTINTIIGRKVVRSRCDSNSVTSVCKCVSGVACEGSNVVAVDTPGLFDTSE